MGNFIDTANLDKNKIEVKANNECKGKIKTIEEYLKAVYKGYKELWPGSPPEFGKQLWFRGVKAQNYVMLPSIARETHNANLETFYLSQFKSKAIPYLGQIPAYPFSEGLMGYWDWLFLMQHYGVPTRLMDWSSDALVALLFATDPNLNEKEKQEDPAVWLLNPIKLNEKFKFEDYYPKGYIPNVEEASVMKLFGPDSESDNKRPAAVYGPDNSPRIIAQKGVFTVFPFIQNMVELDKLPGNKEFLYKILICKEKRDELNEQLRKIGITRAQLFPEMGSIANAIRQEHFWK
ncbi:MAG: FRG domain-containing protein [Deltaproteobacteria bacterium]